jgi:hypothetical protein
VARPVCRRASSGTKDLSSKRPGVIDKREALARRDDVALADGSRKPAAREPRGSWRGFPRRSRSRPGGHRSPPFAPARSSARRGHEDAGARRDRWEAAGSAALIPRAYVAEPAVASAGCPPMRDEDAPVRRRVIVRARPAGATVAFIARHGLAPLKRSCSIARLAAEGGAEPPGWGVR